MFFFFVNVQMGTQYDNVVQVLNPLMHSEFWVCSRNADDHAIIVLISVKITRGAWLFYSKLVSFAWGMAILFRDGILLFYRDGMIMRGYVILFWGSSYSWGYLMFRGVKSLQRIKFLGILLGDSYFSLKRFNFRWYLIIFWVYTCHLCISLYYNKWGITVIYPPPPPRGAREFMI